MTEPATLSLSNLDDAKLEAVLETMFLAAYADGDFGDEERRELHARLDPLLGSRRADLDRLLAKVEANATGERDQRLAAIKAAIPDLRTREMALGLAIRVMAADGMIRTSERELVLELAEGLAIDRDRAADMVKAAS